MLKYALLKNIVEFLFGVILLFVKPWKTAS